MSIRLLLADESPSIKKAFELALKDFGVEVKTVHHGVDVEGVYEAFQPDICFFDVLLPKLNGYEVCKKLKASGSTTPVILMWSGFMEVDQEKFTSSQADNKIEKPFETDTLRKLVKDHLAHLKSNELSEFLVLDEVKGIQDSSTPDDTTDDVSPPPLDALENLPSDVNIPDVPSVDSILGDLSAEPEASDFNINLDEFSMEDLSEESSQNTDKAPEGLEDDFNDFTMKPVHEVDSIPQPEALPELPPLPEINTEESEEGALPPLNLPPLPNLEAQSKKDSPSETNSETALPQEPTADLSIETTKSFSLEDQLSKEDLKRLILAQSKDIIEAVVWDVVPELAREMIKKEIQRLTGEVKYEGDAR